MGHHPLRSFFFAAAALLGTRKILFSYIGPGTSLSAIGSLLACVAGIIVLIIGFLWYPIKRLMDNRSQEPDQVTDKSDNPISDQS